MRGNQVFGGVVVMSAILLLNCCGEKTSTASSNPSITPDGSLIVTSNESVPPSEPPNTSIEELETQSPSEEKVECRNERTFPVQPDQDEEYKLTICEFLNHDSVIQLPTDDRREDYYDQGFLSESNEDTLKKSGKYLAYLSMDQVHRIVDYAFIDGKEDQYVVYALQTKEHEDTEWEILLLKNGIPYEKIHDEDSEYISLMVSAKDKIMESDVNFDRQDDILINRGGFGVQGLQSYFCLLKDKNGIDFGVGYERIPNPEPDTRMNFVRGTVRNNAASYSDYKYQYKNGKFLCMESLTVDWKNEKDRKATIERNINGSMKKVKTIDPYTEDEDDWWFQKK